MICTVLRVPCAWMVTSRVYQVQTKDVVNDDEPTQSTWKRRSVKGSSSGHARGSNSSGIPDLFVFLEEQVCEFQSSIGEWSMFLRSDVLQPDVSPKGTKRTSTISLRFVV